MQEVHALRKREGPDAGLGPVLPRVPTHLQAAAAGGRILQRQPHHISSSFYSGSFFILPVF